MKKFHMFYVIILIIGCKTSNQSILHKSGNELQKESFENGEKFLKRKKLEKAFQAFHISTIYDEKSEIGKISIQKIDSILPVIRKNILEKCKGTWKIKELHPDQYGTSYPDFIEFNNDEVFFFKRISNSEKKLMRKETVKFVEYQRFSLYSESYNLIFSNNEIWSFSVVKKNNVNKLYPSKERDSTGITILLHQSYRGKKYRKNEIKNELTFYTIAK